MEQDQTLLQAIPLHELIIEIDAEYVEQCRAYWQCHRCTFTRQGDNTYMVVFPEGTTEETHLGRSGRYTRETTIRLKNGETFRKITASPLNETQQTRTTMAFPNWVLDGCTPQERSKRIAVPSEE